MQEFVKVHPIIYKIEKKAECKYLVFEKLVLFFIPYSFTYVVNILSNEKEKKFL